MLEDLFSVVKTRFNGTEQNTPDIKKDVKKTDIPRICFLNVRDVQMWHLWTILHRMQRFVLSVIIIQEYLRKNALI